MKENRKILYIGDLRSIHLTRWVKAFIDKGYCVRVLSPFGIIEEDWKGYDLDYTIIPGLYSNSRISFFSTFLSLRKVIALFDPDIIHIHYMPAVFTNIFYYKGLKNLVVSVWGSDIVYDNAAKPESYREFIYKKILLKQARVITATNGFLEDRVLQYFPQAQRIEVIPFGVETEEFKPKKNKKKKDIISISFVKHLERKYGPDFLIRAFSKIVRKCPNTELYMAGDGKLKEELIKITQELGLKGKVHFTGHISHKKVIELLERTDIFVMPSIFETFGVAALEASSMEIPVIATRVGGVSEVVKDGETGFLVEKKNEIQLADALIKLIANAKLRKSMGKKGRRFVKEKYEWNGNVQNMEVIYKNLLYKNSTSKGTSVYQYKKLYNEEYYKRAVGNEEFANLCFSSGGLAPTPYTKKPMEIAKVNSGDKILDIGCGRGEIIAQCTSKEAFAIGIDFSGDAIHIADLIIKKANKKFGGNSRVLISDGMFLPFKNNYFSIVFLLDVVEHVSPQELTKILDEAYRVLKKRGKIIVHSTPNRWKNRFGYLLEDIFLMRRIPKKPAERQRKYLRDRGINPGFVELHINEQTVFSMRKHLRSAGFLSKVWYDRDGNYWSRKSPKKIRDYLISTFYRVLRLKYILGDSIIAVGIKEKQ